MVIDVLRAFTTAAYAFHAGAEEILLVGAEEEAFRLKRERPDLILVGERGGRPIQGFDFGNSPALISRANLRGKTLVLRSSSGTQGVVRSAAADEVLLGSLVVAKATVNYLRRVQAPLVSFLAMGSVDGPDGDEDVACSDYMSALARDEDVDLAVLRRRVAASPAGRQALDPAIEWITPEDLECAVAVDRFDFAMAARRRGGVLAARRVEPGPTPGGNP